MTIIPIFLTTLLLWPAVMFGRLSKFSFCFLSIPEPTNVIRKFDFQTYDAWFRKRNNASCVCHTKFANLLKRLLLKYGIIVVSLQKWTSGFSPPQLSFQAKWSQCYNNIHDMFVTLTKELKMHLDVYECMKLIFTTLIQIKTLMM